MSDVWFARVSGSGRGRMSPVTREGWMVVAGFCIAMVAGAGLLAALMAVGFVALGIIVAGGGFIWAAVAHGDSQRPVAEYRRVNRGGPT